MGLTDRVKEGFQNVRKSLTSTESKSSESFADKAFQSFIQGGAGLRDQNFIKDIYNEKRQTPHVEMRKAQRLYANEPLVVTSTELMADAIMGDELKVETEDEETKIFFEDKILPNLKVPLREAIENTVITGNGYIEILRTQGKGIPLSFKSISRPEQMYIDYSKGFNPDRYVLRQPGMEATESYTVNYWKSKKTIMGVSFDPDEIIHLKYGVSHLPVYGRSGLCSATNAGKIMRELERDMAVIARWKAIGRFFIQLKNMDGSAVNDKERQKFQESLKNLDDFENMVMNKDIELDQMSYNSKHENVGEMLNQLKKKVTSSLAPRFYIHGDVTNYAVAQEQKNAYYLRIQAIRDQFSQPINKILKEIAKKRGLSEDIKIQFGEFDFPTRGQKVSEAKELWKNGAITIKQMAEMIPYDIQIPDDMPEDAYKFELTQENPLESAVQQAFSEEDKTKESEEG